MIEPKLELKKLSDGQIEALLKLVAKEMADPEGVAVFTTPDPALSVLTADATSISTLHTQRASRLQEAQQLTIQIRQARDLAESHLTKEATYVNGIANGDPAIIALAGMGVSDDTATPVGPMPKVENLHAAQGDADGEIDLNWNPVGRGLQNYRVEITTDPAGQTGWTFKMNAGGKSKVTVTGLTSGQRYWFRVVAEGAGGPGAPSDIATKVAP